MAVMSEIVRGGATKPAGNATPGATFGAASVGTATATLARLLAACSFAITQAFTFGVALTRQASRPPPPPCMHAMTMGRPTLMRHCSMAASLESSAKAGLRGKQGNVRTAKPPRIKALLLFREKTGRQLATRQLVQAHNLLQEN